MKKLKRIVKIREITYHMEKPFDKEREEKGILGLPKV